MKLFGTIKQFFISKGIKAIYPYVKHSANDQPYIITYTSKEYTPEEEVQVIFFTNSFGKGIPKGAELPRNFFKKCVVWETVSSDGTPRYKIGRTESLEVFKPYAELVKEKGDLQYIEKLRALEWRAKRRQIIERENACCEICKKNCWNS